MAATDTTVPPVPTVQTAPVPKPTPINNIPGVNLTGVNAGGDISGSLIAPGQMADRVANATSLLNTWNTTTQPQFEADKRSVTSNNAALGKLGSGGLRTSLGDLAYNRDLQRNGQAQNFYTNALNGSIDDAYKNLGIEQQQQQYQAGRADTAFNQGVTTQQLGDQEYNDLFGQNLATSQFNAGRSDTAFGQDLASKQLANTTQAQQFGQGVTTAQLGDTLTNSAHSRALQDYLTGTSGDPSSTYLGLSGLYGGQASSGANNLSNLIGNTVAKNGANSNNEQLLAILKQYGLLDTGNAATPTATIPAVSDPYSYGGVTG